MKTTHFHSNSRLFLAALISTALIALYSCVSVPVQEPVSPETALQSYLENNDTSFAWEVTGSRDLEGMTSYSLILTSQQWREHTWKHSLTILAPARMDHDGALLFITGGSLDNGQPSVPGSDDGFIQAMAQVAHKNNAMVAVIKQIPNQPLYNGLVEDELISYTLHNYKNDGDFTWPLLFPMVKSAVKAMDAIQEFSSENLQHEISRFVLTGASKRGWTTWLTGASDSRAEAIAPIVIDVLNMPVNLDYQVEVWGDYSIQIQDYVDLGIPQDVHSDKGNDITTMVDPYSYREKLTMPKMIFIGTNDEYWPVDAIKNYLDEIPGENYIHYVPNAGHDLGDGEQAALMALSAFFGNTLRKENYPACNWLLSEDEGHVTLSVETTPEKLAGALLWSSASDDRDFRNETWSAVRVGTGDKSVIELRVDLPESGYKAFYLDLRYSDPMGGEYTKSTRMFVADAGGVL